MKHQVAADLWLNEVGLYDSHDPNVILLRSVAQELDDLEKDVYENLTDMQKLAASRSTRNTLAATRKALQTLVERTDSEASRRRHQLIYAEIAAESLGYVDATLLSEKLRAKVAKELAEVHNIDLAIYEPIQQEG